MDAKKFGSFIARMRKDNNMTQAALAEKLHVTDKAVSKWERGLGFPDINTIEPLADTLGVSVLEIMKSEKLDMPIISNEEISETLLDTFELVKLQRKEERKSVMMIIGSIVFILLAIFLFDTVTNVGYFVVGVLLPVICFLSGIVLLMYCLFRRKNKLPCLQTFVIAMVFLSLPLVFVMVLFVSGALGIGPVPN